MAHSTRKVYWRDRVWRDWQDGIVEGFLRALGLLHGQLVKPIGGIPSVSIYDGDFAAAQVLWYVRNQIYSHSRSKNDLLRARGNALPVHRDHLEGQLAQGKIENARIGDIDQPHSDPFPCMDLCLTVEHTIYRREVADPSAMRHVVHRPEILDDLSVFDQSPIIEEPGNVSVHFWWIIFLDDERPSQATVNLLDTAHMRVEPVGPGIMSFEAIGEVLTRLYRRLRQIWNAIHFIWQANPMPMNCGC